MADIEVLATALSSFRLFNARPVAAAAWSSLVALEVLVFLALCLGPMIVGLQNRTGLLAALGALIVLIPFLLIVPITLSAVIAGAVYRAVLDPSDAGFFSIRLGRRERSVLASLFVQGLVIGLAQAVLTVTVTLIMGPLKAAGGAGGVTANVLTDVVDYAFATWLNAGFAMAGPMSFAEGRYRLFASWSLTRGRILRLMAVAIVLDVISTAISVVLAGLGVVMAFPILRDHWPKGNLWDKGVFDTFMAALPPSSLLSVELILAALIFIGGIVLIPVMIAPWADAYRRLAYGDHYDVFD